MRNRSARGLRVEVRSEEYEFDGWQVFRLYALLAEERPAVLDRFGR